MSPSHILPERERKTTARKGLLLRLGDHPHLCNILLSPLSQSNFKSKVPSNSFHSSLGIQEVRRRCFPSFKKLQGPRRPLCVYTRVLTGSSPAPFPSRTPEAHAGCPAGPARARGRDGAKRPRQTVSQRLHLGEPPDRLGPGVAVALPPSASPAAGAPRKGRARLRRQPRLPPAPRPDPLLPIGPGPAPPRALVLPPAGPARTCRTRCRASTKPSAFIPTGALCPCTSSAITAPAAAAAQLPRPASSSAWGPVAGKGKSPHFRRKGSRDAGSERSRVCGGAGPGHVIPARPEVGAGPRARGRVQRRGRQRSGLEERGAVPRPDLGQARR